MNKAIEFLQEDNGNFSSSRLAFLLWVVGVLFTWILLSITSGSLQPLDNSVTAILGILMTGKVAQKFGENPKKAGVQNPPETAAAP